MKLVDKFGHWLGTNLTPIWQMRMGVMMLFIGIAFVFYMPISGEQWGIFMMSALALIFSGPQVIVTALLAIDQMEGHSVEELDPDA